MCTNQTFQTMVSDLVVCHPCTPKIEVRRSANVKSLSISCTLFDRGMRRYAIVVGPRALICVFCMSRVTGV